MISQLDAKCVNEMLIRFLHLGEAQNYISSTVQPLIDLHSQPRNIYYLVIDGLLPIPQLRRHHCMHWGLYLHSCHISDAQIHRL